jgi:hypothetical protein
VPTNLALSGTASADSTQNPNFPSRGNDGNTSTRWSAADSGLNHWWQVDLGAIRTLTSSQVMWQNSGVVYKYKIEVSTNGTTWTQVVDKTNNTSTAQTQTDTFSASGRFVRITVTGLPFGSSASFFEFQALGY